MGQYHIRLNLKPICNEQQSTEHRSLKSQEELADLSSDSKLQHDISKKQLHIFWLSVRAGYPSLSD